MVLYLKDESKTKNKVGRKRPRCSLNAGSSNSRSSLDIVMEEDRLLRCLANILVESFIKKKRDEYTRLKQKESGSVLPRIDQRTS
jgi:hypothetical protein